LPHRSRALRSAFPQTPFLVFRFLFFFLVFFLGPLILIFPRSLCVGGPFELLCGQPLDFSFLPILFSSANPPFLTFLGRRQLRFSTLFSLCCVCARFFLNPIPSPFSQFCRPFSPFFLNFLPSEIKVPVVFWNLSPSLVFFFPLIEGCGSQFLFFGGSCPPKFSSSFISFSPFFSPFLSLVCFFLRIILLTTSCVLPLNGFAPLGDLFPPFALLPPLFSSDPFQIFRMEFFPNESWTAFDFFPLQLFGFFLRS